MHLRQTLQTGLVLIALATPLMYGCSSDPATGGVSLSGTWKGSLAATGQFSTAYGASSVSANADITFVLVQSGNSITGTFVATTTSTTNPQLLSGSSSGPVNGSINGTAITFSSPAGTCATKTMTGVVNGNSITLSHTATGCTGSSVSNGTITQVGTITKQ